MVCTISIIATEDCMLLQRSRIALMFRAAGGCNWFRYSNMVPLPYMVDMLMAMVAQEGLILGSSYGLSSVAQKQCALRAIYMPEPSTLGVHSALLTFFSMPSKESSSFLGAEKPSLLRVSILRAKPILVLGVAIFCKICVASCW